MCSGHRELPANLLLHHSSTTPQAYPDMAKGVFLTSYPPLPATTRLPPATSRFSTQKLKLLDLASEGSASSPSPGLPASPRLTSPHPPVTGPSAPLTNTPPTSPSPPRKPPSLGHSPVPPRPAPSPQGKPEEGLQAASRPPTATPPGHEAARGTPGGCSPGPGALPAGRRRPRARRR